MFLTKSSQKSDNKKGQNCVIIFRSNVIIAALTHALPHLRGRGLSKGGGVLTGVERGRVALRLLDLLDLLVELEEARVKVRLLAFLRHALPSEPLALEGTFPAAQY